MPSKQAKKRSYNKQYRAANIDIITAHGKSYSEEHDRKQYFYDYHANESKLTKKNSAASSKACYHKDPEKSREESTARSKACYKDPEKSREESTARSKACYHKDPEKSREESTARSKACYHKDPEKSSVQSAATSSDSYHKDIDTNRNLKRQRYVSMLLCN